MKIKISHRNSFYLCGYMTETCLESCKEDFDALWRTYESKKENLFQLFGRKKDFYGLMWYTQLHRYCYLIGIEVNDDKKTPKGAVCRHVPSSLYAVAAIPAGTPATDAWTEFFEVALPSLGYRPDAEHGLYFEYYPSGENGDYELWTPVILSILTQF